MEGLRVSVDPLFIFMVREQEVPHRKSGALPSREVKVPVKRSASAFLLTDE